MESCRLNFLTKLKTESWPSMPN